MKHTPEFTQHLSALPEVMPDSSKGPLAFYSMLFCLQSLSVSALKEALPSRKLPLSEHAPLPLPGTGLSSVTGFASPEVEDLWKYTWPGAHGQVHMKM